MWPILLAVWLLVFRDDGIFVTRDELVAFFSVVGGVNKITVGYVILM